MLQIAPGEPWVSWLNRAEEVLRAGGVVAYPSETVWGLAALPDVQGVQRLFEVKGRSESKPVQASFLNLSVARPFVEAADTFERLTVFLPGPLTIVTPASAACPVTLAPGGRVGVRVPDHPVALALLERMGGVLATTSCNRSGAPAALSAVEAQQLGLADLVVPDGGVRALGLPSTVLDLAARRVLRKGAIPAAQIMAVLEGAP
ncbi:SUA5-like protein [Deinococcus radiotolerans]|uniref:L-threonylcarbamoyladenylate synthase n=1 Tax=Deinococcus radiotolerans TaxID=1309407 RepID=A0ABQ2FL05_9DEIO|nr:SUA5-like protein [Deinococcus radiotolerans]